MYGGAESVFNLTYIYATAPKCDTIVCCVDLPYLYCELNVKCLSEEDFDKWVYQKIKGNKPLGFSEEYFRERLHEIKRDSTIYEFYCKNGVAGLMKEYPVALFDKIPYEKVEYIGWLLWQNDICLTYDGEYKEWSCTTP